jgi:hypothetical protein
VAPPAGPSGTSSGWLTITADDGTVETLLIGLPENALHLVRIDGKYAQTLYCSPGITSVQWSADQRSVNIAVEMAESPDSYSLALATGQVVAVSASVSTSPAATPTLVAPTSTPTSIPLATPTTVAITPHPPTPPSSPNPLLVLSASLIALGIVVAIAIPLVRRLSRSRVRTTVSGE